MSRNDPLEVGKILDKLKKTTTLGKQLELALIWERWNEIAGAHLAAHGEPKTVRDDVLYVEAESPVWMHRFTYKKWAILKRINQMAGRELVSDLFIVLKADEEAETPGPDAPKTP